MSKEVQKVWLRGVAKSALAKSRSEIEEALKLFEQPRHGLGPVKMALKGALANIAKAQDRVDGVAITEGEKAQKGRR